MTIALASHPTSEGSDGSATPPAEPGTGGDPSAAPSGRLRWLVALAVVIVVAVGALVVLTRHPSSAGAPMPSNAAMEQAFGVRFTRVAVVADGGLVQVNYLCLDPSKASEFQSDTAHPPVLASESRAARTAVVALMKKGHAMTAGQTYYFVYRNSGVVQRDEFASLTYGGRTLAHIPVL
ncbi:hypothetical protein [Phycicoccus duodecadis]|uniref:Uncharacterized protein n=1 Tax=Phycicoccus duodecadis TaxID=173053 RepID=A0A2N3YF79_9MICO|nr:hypothetical protein [Phycicoccus duodecadis]PKW25476.1 hypothetical protein ATL31_0267 [Phycicoccus duodecadis]